jgi:hypothetical protein
MGLKLNGAIVSLLLIGILASPVVLLPFSPMAEAAGPILRNSDYSRTNGSGTSATIGLTVYAAGDLEVILITDSSSSGNCPGIVTGVSGSLSGAWTGVYDSGCFTQSGGLAPYEYELYVFTVTAPSAGSDTITLSFVADSGHSLYFQTGDISTLAANVFDVASYSSGEYSCGSGCVVTAPTLSNQGDEAIGVEVNEGALGGAANNPWQTLGGCDPSGECEWEHADGTIPPSYSFISTGWGGYQIWIVVWGASFGSVHSSTSTTGITGKVEGLDCGDCMLQGKFYNFVANVTITSSSSSQIVTDSWIKFAFNDGVHQFSFGYDYPSGQTRIYSGTGYITVGSATVAQRTAGLEQWINVSIPAALTSQVLDAGGRTVTASFQLSDGNSRSVIISAGLTLLSEGGATTHILMGNATLIAGEGPFGCQVSWSGLCAVNSTWVGLQHYESQFAITLGTPGTAGTMNGNPYLWQDYANSFCGIHCYEHYTWPDTWSIVIRWFGYDSISQTWNDLFWANISMATGNQGSADEWTTLRVLWYQGPVPGTAQGATLVQNESVTAWMEQGKSQVGAVAGQVRLFADLWLSSDNSSTIGGGRIGVYFTGMSSSGYWWWTSWAPTFANETATISEAMDRGYVAGGAPAIQPLSAQEITCSKIEFEVSRQQTRNLYYTYPADKYYTIFVHSFEIQDFQTTNDISKSGGIATPDFVAAQVPNLPQGSFLAPLYALFSSMWSNLAKAFGDLWSTIWNGLGAEFPWFTGFWDNVGSMLSSFFGLFMTVVPDVIAALGFVAQAAGFIWIPISIVAAAWALIQSWFSVFKGVNTTQIIELVIIVWFGGTIMEWAESGDWGTMFNFTLRVWRIAQTILYWTYWLVRAIVDEIVAVIP